MAGWTVTSEDERIQIDLQVDGVNAIYVDGAYCGTDGLPDVEELLQDLTNVAVRDLWNEAH